MEQDAAAAAKATAAAADDDDDPTGDAAERAAGLVAAALRLTPPVLLPGDVAEVPTNMTRVRLGTCVRSTGWLRASNAVYCIIHRGRSVARSLGRSCACVRACVVRVQ